MKKLLLLLVMIGGFVNAQLPSIEFTVFEDSGTTYGVAIGDNIIKRCAEGQTYVYTIDANGQRYRDGMSLGSPNPAFIPGFESGNFYRLYTRSESGFGNAINLSDQTNGMFNFSCHVDEGDPYELRQSVALGLANAASRNLRNGAFEVENDIDAVNPSVTITRISTDESISIAIGEDGAIISGSIDGVDLSGVSYATGDNLMSFYDSVVLAINSGTQNVLPVGTLEIGAGIYADSGIAINDPVQQITHRDGVFNIERTGVYTVSAFNTAFIQLAATTFSIDVIGNYTISLSLDANGDLVAVATLNQ